MEKQIYGFLVILMAVIFASGCNPAKHNVAMQNGYMPNPSSKIEVGKVSNTTGEKFEFNIEEMLSDALQEKLLEEKMLFVQGEGTKLTINCNIVNYEAGNAAARYLVPGTGGTSLTIQCELLEFKNVVGSITATRVVNIGAFGGIGAWKNVFGEVASDVAIDIKSKITNGNNTQVPVKHISNKPPADTADGQTGSKEKDDIARLDKLKNMKERGLITQQEYDKKRKEILDAM